MADRTPLSLTAITAALAELPGWSGDASGIRRTIKAPSFLAGIAVVDAVALAAEDLDHHPDIDIRWRTISFFLVTHSAGGLTRLDVDLARRIDAIARAAHCKQAESTSG
ncbi:MAG: 4a-hydroxytetrahydrobiopterin dehydratase [Sporichthyaceae bacterium]